MDYVVDAEASVVSIEKPQVSTKLQLSRVN